MAMQQYNAPNGSPSTIGGDQYETFMYQRKALMEKREEQYFTQLADMVNMPRNYGKQIKMYHYLPLLDEENQNSQGIDAAGVAIDPATYYITLEGLVQSYTVEANATAAAAAINAVESGKAVKSGAGPWTVTYSKVKFATTDSAKASAVTSDVWGSKAILGSGNMYGSSKDIGVIVSKLPVLGETGGRVNRVGLKRKEITGSMYNLGFFFEYTADSLQFDSDMELEKHIQRELLNGAVELSESILQVDLLNAAGTTRFAGGGLSNATLDTGDIVSYSDLMRLSIELDDNRTPKHTKVISGTTMVDSKTINSCRVMYVGTEMLPTLKAMKDLHNNPAYVEARHYAAGTTLLKGEEGAIDNFRIVVVPKMLKWANAGAKATDATYYAGDTRYDVFPMLVVGDESFTTIGFQIDGKSGTKFRTIHKKPGVETADRNNPYGKDGFTSIEWWYGFLAMRPERIALIKTLAKM